MYSTTHYCVYMTPPPPPQHPSKSGIKSHKSSVRSPDYVCVMFMCACASVGGGGGGGGQDTGCRLITTVAPRITSGDSMTQIECAYA